MDMRAKLKAGLTQRGLAPHIADAFIMNFQDESGLNPGINEASPTVPGSRGGYGLYQLTGPRRRQYEAFASQKGAPLDSVDAQLDFMMEELRGSESNAAKDIFAAKDTGSAAAAIVNKFLRPAEQHRASRVARYTGGSSDDTLLGGLSLTPDRMGAPPILDMMEAPQMEPQKATGILGSLFGDMTQERADQIRLGVNGMLHNPNRGLERQVQARMDDRRDAKKTHAAAQQAAQQANKTAQYIATQLNRPDLAQAVLQGVMTGRDAYAEATKAAPKPEYTYQDGQWYDKNNPQAGPVAMPAGTTAPVDAKGESDLRKEYTGRSDVKSFKDQATAFAQIRAAAEQPDAAGDLSLIFSFMKLMDPGSTVREGEFLTAQNAAGLDQRTRNVWNNLQNGERLSPEQRAEFVGRAGKLYEAARIQNENTETQFRDTASQYGYDTQRAVPDVSYQSPYAPMQSGPRPGTRPSAPPAGPPTPPALTREQLASAVAGLSQHDRQLLSSIPGAQAKVRFLMERGVINGQ